MDAGVQEFSEHKQNLVVVACNYANLLIPPFHIELTHLAVLRGVAAAF
jgi:hypothetical protein